MSNATAIVALMMTVDSFMTLLRPLSQPVRDWVLEPDDIRTIGERMEIAHAARAIGTGFRALGHRIGAIPPAQRNLRQRNTRVERAEHDNADLASQLAESLASPHKRRNVIGQKCDRKSGRYTG